jgi:two-component system response regulator AtoC
MIRCENCDFELHSFHGMVTASARMLDFFDLVKRVARTDSSVLIRGQTGTGKELVARALHEVGRRSGGPFRALNCATLTPELLASELFGHVRGAFTGAIRDRKGLFELADGGTVFLDEISEIPVDIQARLLRVLEERVFTPVGGTDPVSVNVRVVSASNKALRHAVENKTFREDLMYRIRVVPLFLPPLVERLRDVEALFWHFIQEFNETEVPRTIEGVSEDAYDALRDYHWPGNVRELRNAVEYAFAVGEGPELTIDELPPELRGEEPQRVEPLDADALERRRILRALAETGGHRGETADLLGMSRSTLWRKMKTYHLD